MTNTYLAMKSHPFTCREVICDHKHTKRTSFNNKKNPINNHKADFSLI